MGDKSPRKQNQAKKLTTKEKKAKKQARNEAKAPAPLIPGKKGK